MLADTEGEITGKYGVDTRGGTAASRTTFVIAADGTIARVFEKVRVDGHADEVLAVLQELGK